MKQALSTKNDEKAPRRMPSKKTSTTIRFRLEEERVTEILDVAAEVFLSDGFTAASTNEIAKRANASKGTFYSRFPSKEELFMAVMERRMATVSDSLGTSLPQEPTTMTTLLSFGSRLLKEVLSQEQVSLIRIIGMESGRFPDLGRRFYELGPKRAQHLLAEYFQGQIRSGRLRRADPMRMAEHLMSLLMGGEVRWSILGLIPEPISPKRIKEHLSEAVKGFLHAYGAPEEIHS